jgi:hypothetical protein
VEEHRRIADERRHSVLGDELVLVKQESWLKRNAIPLLTAIISVAVILGTFVTKMAGYESELATIRIEQTKIETHLTDLNLKVDGHHIDTVRHLDGRQWELLQNQILEIQNLLRTHMRRTGN